MKGAGVWKFLKLFDAGDRSGRHQPDCGVEVQHQTLRSGINPRLGPHVFVKLGPADDK
jgi:hypothetical protein